MRIYIESTIPSYVVARPARDLLQAARQQITKDWWDRKRPTHDLFSSQLVLDEIAFGEAVMAKQRLKTMQGIPLVDVTERADNLTSEILSRRILPQFADRDAAHIALATTHKMDVLLTWNCRHIANGAIQARLRDVVESSDYRLPTICTPEELMDSDYG